MIDVSPFLTGDAEAKQRVARQIGDACRDIGFLTIVGHGVPDSLIQATYDTAKAFFDLPEEEKKKVDRPAPGALVVNIGDLMMQWTNDLWRSTMHRVVNPPRDKALGSRRISLVFFHQPNYDAMVECLAGCARDGEAPKYAPVSSGDHLLSKFVKQTTFGTGVG
jgi:isopenicillin N synthase-like dioxygenase